ncbi:phage tail protein [Pseudomonas fluorescens]|uniref:Phage tail protein n=1 Tax=Pseudomonas fluorescens TaxID=294 RepID=A0A944DRT9_PSEFL|nr:phage tail protein [Pseudomonas fluorescens]MBT2294567.1 phage tail protein [Pseudomonas fluorescens]MBT2306777.1 phage tail protein [Pseudomonas fluorescens]MBT2316313.1 phage tail protein [Pseudomonas fluorescens]MBT2331650.1 phage tail protein [Pseudomonas fluorescens]MBT2342818.1 phage tail protein [Pseudomonas fluorescens]
MVYIISAAGGFLHAAEDAAGYENWTSSPLPQPCWNPRFVGKRIQETGEWVGQWVHDGEPAPTDFELCAKIDRAADEARQIVAGDPLRAVEYDRAAAEARAFKDAGYPDDVVPRTVAAWAISGRSPMEAANHILAEAAEYAEVLYVIREHRLLAKELIRQKIAEGAFEEATLIAANAVDAIQRAATGVGNAKS